RGAHAGGDGGARPAGTHGSRAGERAHLLLRGPRPPHRERDDGLQRAVGARRGDSAEDDASRGAGEPRRHSVGGHGAALVEPEPGPRRRRLRRVPRRRGRPIRPRGLDPRADDRVRRPRRAAGHVPLRRDGAGSSLAPQPESALQRGDGQRALTSPRVDATNKRYMAHFAYRHSDLYCEQVSLRSLAADAGTPAYVYSKAALLESYRGYDDAFAEVPHVVCYSVKANGNLGVLATLARVGAGADIVSGGELFRGVRAPVALRVNPDVDPETHPYIATGLKTSKFGIPFAQAHEVYAEAASLKGVEVVGADMHIGSQLTKAAPLADAVARIAALVKTLRERSIELRMVDVGGGLGIRYRDEAPPTHREYARVLLPALRELAVTVLLEPGRSIVGNAGI